MASRRVGLLAVALALLPLATVATSPKQRARRRRTARLPTDAPRCCAAFAPSTCPEGPGGVGSGGSSDSCCDAPGLPRTCASLKTRDSCERARPTPPPKAAGREVCAWIGGRCTAASLADCAEPPAAAAPDYYGEAAAFASSCGAGSECDGFKAALERYAAMHEAATRDAEPAEGIANARVRARCLCAAHSRGSVSSPQRRRSLALCSPRPRPVTSRSRCSRRSRRSCSSRCSSSRRSRSSSSSSRRSSRSRSSSRRSSRRRRSSSSSSRRSLSLSLCAVHSCGSVSSGCCRSSASR